MHNEDATAFEWNGNICLLTTDNHGDVTGVRGGGALWVSEDGVSFNPRWRQLGFDTIPAYFPGYDPLRATRVYGGDPKFERPRILTIDGKPAYLYAPSGWNVLGGKRTVILAVDWTQVWKGVRGASRQPPGLCGSGQLRSSA